VALDPASQVYMAYVLTGTPLPSSWVGSLGDKVHGPRALLLFSKSRGLQQQSKGELLTWQGLALTSMSWGPWVTTSPPWVSGFL
jgi:hypothetical protein